MKVLQCWWIMHILPSWANHEDFWPESLRGGDPGHGQHGGQGTTQIWATSQFKQIISNFVERAESYQTMRE